MADLREKQFSSGLLAEESMVEIAAQVVRQAPLDAKTLAHCLDRATVLARYAHRKFCPQIKVKSLQRPWSIRLDSMLRRRGLGGMKIDYVGTMDIEEWLYDFTHLTTPAGVGVLDLKTSRATPPVNAANTKHWIQLTSYALGLFTLDQVLPQQVRIGTLVSLKGGVGLRWSQAERDDHDFAGLMNRLEQFARSYKKEMYLPASPANWRCSPTWCQFHSTCPFVRNQKTVSLAVPKLVQIKSCVRSSPESTFTGIKSVVEEMECRKSRPSRKQLKPK